MANKQFVLAQVEFKFYILEKTPNQSYWSQRGLGFKSDADALRWAATCNIPLSVNSN